MQTSEQVCYVLSGCKETLAFKLDRHELDCDMPELTTYSENYKMRRQLSEDYMQLIGKAFAQQFTQGSVTSMLLILHLCEATGSFENLCVTAWLWTDDQSCMGVVEPLTVLTEHSVFSTSDLMLSTLLSPDHQDHCESLSCILSRLGMEDDEKYV